MAKLFEKPYSEVKDHPLKLLLWRIVNAIVFPVVTNRQRMMLLRWFGARIENWLVIRPNVKIYAPWNLEVRAPWAVLGPRVRVYNKAKVTLGAQVTVSQDAYICTASHDVSSPVMALVTKPIVLDKDCWVAARAIILPGVTMHEGSVAGCAAVVTKDVEPWTVVGGNPAKVIKRRELRG